MSEKRSILFQAYLKNSLQINFNWSIILLFVFCWNHGIFGSVLTQNTNIILFFISTLLMSIIISFLSYFGLANSKNFIGFVSIKGKDILHFLIYFIIIILFSYENFISYIKFDPLLHSALAHIHGVKFLLYDSIFLEKFENLKFNWVLAIFNLFALFGLLIFALFIRWLKNINLYYAIAMIVFTFILSRIVIYSAGGYGSGHPPFRIFPVWLTSTLFFLSDFSFKMPGIFALIILMCYLQKEMHKSIDYFSSCLFGLSIGLIPILLYSSLIVEPSIWASTIITVFLIDLYNSAMEQKFDFFKWLIIIVIGSLMRQGIVALFAPFAILIILYKDYTIFSIKKIRLQSIIIIFTWAIFFVFSLLVGTGGTKHIVNDSMATNMIMNFLNTLESGIVKNAFIRDIDSHLIPFFIFAFIPIQKNIKVFTNSIIISISFLFLLFLYTSSSAYGFDSVSRYQAEYFVPFVILGYYKFYLVIKNQFFSKTIYLLIPPLIVLLLNINSFTNNYRYRNILTKNQKEIHFGALGSSNIFNYNKLYDYLKKKKSLGHTLFMGTKGKLFSQILSDLSISDVKKQESIFNQLPEYAQVTDIVNSLDQIEDIKYVVVENSFLYNNKNKFYDKSFFGSETIEGNGYAKKLKSSGWLEDTTFIDDNLKYDLILFRKNKIND